MRYPVRLTLHPGRTPPAFRVLRTFAASALALAALLSLPLTASEARAAPAAGQTPVQVPEARSVDLGKPVTSAELLDYDALRRRAQVTPDTFDRPAAQTAATAPGLADSLPDLELANPLLLLGARVPPGTSTRLAWSPSQSLEGISVPTPVLVVNGAGNGPTLCLTAAIHGDELNGIEIVRRVLYNLDPQELSGAVIGIPIVNLQGFRLSSRYLTDRRDLNRYFPGHSQGSSAARIADSFFNDVVRQCDALVDLHTGSFHRTNLLQLRADVTDPAIRDLSQGFGSTVVLQGRGAQGTLRRAAADQGIPAVTLEAGASMRLDEDSVLRGVEGIQTLLAHLKMTKRFRFWGNPEPVYYQSRWVRANQGGILMSSVALGQAVKPGELLGTVTDPITNESIEIRSPLLGRVIGMALNQVVLPGYAAYHIGTQAADELRPSGDGDNPPVDEDVADYEDDPPEDDFLAE